jgi:hypothetical protein
MPILSHVDATAPIACTLPVNEFGDRLRSLEAIVGDDVREVVRAPGSIRIAIARRDRGDLEDQVTRWAVDEKACCTFLGFAVDADDETVTIEIEAPPSADRTLDGIDWLVQAAGRRAATAS